MMLLTHGEDLEIKKKKFNEFKDIIKLYEIRFTDNQDMLVVNDMIVLSKNKNIKKIILMI